MKNFSTLTALLVLFSSCYSYKNLKPLGNDFVQGEKYEIRIGNREMQRVLIKQVTDSTIVVEQNKTEITIQKSMITESRIRKFATGKTIVASTLGVLLIIATFGVISLSSGGGDGPILECC
ncbi:hypothetical protein [Flagellimonas nanhaiensis]|uniref:Uncharacterized protein n=1 Tax=Flagellimonas nanhaiensis TaxID=2292706 RepID=A0A371JS59_9FLAO|nr:hypothetical protein [Allomuricauda nanhaiensis]RDY60654.1 hypothetical protein DX873_00285 [Allomuricauda nanhaiensis]